MDIEEAKEHLRIKIKITKQQINNGELWLDTLVEGEKKDIQAIETVLSELEKKDKVINEMAKWLYEDDTSFGYGNLAEVNTQEKIKEYFTNKVEKFKKCTAYLKNSANKQTQ